MKGEGESSRCVQSITVCQEPIGNVGVGNFSRDARQWLERKWQQKGGVKLVLPSIDPSMLEDPAIDGKIRECYLGRGSFGIVQLQVYRTIAVLVKEFLPRSLVDDVTNAANLLASLSSISSLFGV